MTTHRKPMPKVARRALSAKVSKETRLEMIDSAYWWLADEAPKRLARYVDGLQYSLIAMKQLVTDGDRLLERTGISLGHLRRNRFCEGAHGRLDAAKQRLQEANWKQAEALNDLEERKAEIIKRGPKLTNPKELTWGIQAFESAREIAIQQNPDHQATQKELGVTLSERYDAFLKDASVYLGSWMQLSVFAVNYRLQRNGHLSGNWKHSNAMKRCYREYLKLLSWREGLQPLISEEAFNAPVLRYASRFAPKAPCSQPDDTVATPQGA